MFHYISRHTQKGFSLVEVLVTVALFSIIAVLAVGAFMSILDANSKVRSQSVATNSLQLVMEKIQREVRDGQGGLSNASNILSFIDRDGNNVEYRHDSGDGRIYRRENGGTWNAVTPESLTIQNFDLTMLPQDFGGATQQPGVVVSIQGVAAQGTAEQSTFEVETVVSEPLFNLGDRDIVTYATPTPASVVPPAPKIGFPTTEPGPSTQPMGVLNFDEFGTGQYVTAKNTFNVHCPWSRSTPEFTVINMEQGKNGGRYWLTERPEVDGGGNDADGWDTRYCDSSLDPTNSGCILQSWGGFVCNDTDRRRSPKYSISPPILPPPYNPEHGDPGAWPWDPKCQMEEVDGTPHVDAIPPGTYNIGLVTNDFWHCNLNGVSGYTDTTGDGVPDTCTAGWWEETTQETESGYLRFYDSGGSLIPTTIGGVSPGLDVFGVPWSVPDSLDVADNATLAIRVYEDVTFATPIDTIEFNHSMWRNPNTGIAYPWIEPQGLGCFLCREEPSMYTYRPAYYDNNGHGTIDRTGYYGAGNDMDFPTENTGGNNCFAGDDCLHRPGGSTGIACVAFENVLTSDSTSQCPPNEAGYRAWEDPCGTDKCKPPTMDISGNTYNTKCCGGSGDWFCPDDPNWACGAAPNECIDNSAVACAAGLDPCGSGCIPPTDTCCPQLNGTDGSCPSGTSCAPDGQCFDGSVVSQTTPYSTEIDEQQEF